MVSGTTMSNGLGPPGGAAPELEMASGPLNTTAASLPKLLAKSVLKASGALGVVEKLNGEVKLMSVFGQGTTFTFTFPL